MYKYYQYKKENRKTKNLYRKKLNINKKHKNN